LRGLQDLFRWHVEELGGRVDEALDDPRARDAIDLGSFAGYPAGSAADRFPRERKAAFGPRGEAALEIARLDPDLREFGGSVLADLVAVHAVKNHAARNRQLGRPTRDRFRVAAQGAGDHRPGGTETGLAPDIEEERRPVGSDGGGAGIPGE